MGYTIKLPKHMKTASDVYVGDKVRLTFSNIQKTKYLVIYVGKDLMTRLGYTKNDRYALGIDDIDPMVWAIIKAENGWKMYDYGKSCRIQIPWKSLELGEKIPEGLSEKHLLFLDNDLHGGVIRIFLPGHDPISRNL